MTFQPGHANLNLARRSLDRARPYGEIHGGPRVLFDQDGIIFDAAGVEMKHGLPPEVDDSPPPDAPLVDYRSLRVLDLKLAVKSFGGEYANKQQALDFLEGRATINQQ